MNISSQRSVFSIQYSMTLTQQLTSGNRQTIHTLVIKIDMKNNNSFQLLYLKKSTIVQAKENFI